MVVVGSIYTFLGERGALRVDAYFGVATLLLGRTLVFGHFNVAWRFDARSAVGILRQSVRESFVNASDGSSATLLAE